MKQNQERFLLKVIKMVLETISKKCPELNSHFKSAAGLDVLLLIEDKYNPIAVICNKYDRKDNKCEYTHSECLYHKGWSYFEFKKYKK